MQYSENVSPQKLKWNPSNRATSFLTPRPTAASPTQPQNTPIEAKIKHPRKPDLMETKRWRRTHAEESVCAPARKANNLATN
mmetsp:Transcript_13820/g.23564  ORF Transcript_13820/g.23564 Transcript_13820/m.23564 type:complete len:82 (+) Transcript_13820:93-338(+)